MKPNLKNGIILALIASIIATSFIGIAYAKNEQYKETVYMVDMSKVHLKVGLYEYQNGRVSDALPPLQDIDLMYRKISGKVSEKNKELDNRISFNLVKVQGQINEKADEKEIEATIQQIIRDLDEVKKLLVPASELQKLDLKIQIIMDYLPHAYNEYAEGVVGGKITDQAEYDEAVAVLKDAQNKYGEIESSISAKNPEENEKIKELFQSLISSAENLESPNKIKGFVDEINIELMEVAGIESETSIFIVANAPGQSTDKVIKEIKNLLSSSLEEYKNGNFENSYDLAVSAYLDRYEDIEGAVASKDNALNSKLESKFSKLRSQINSRADEEEINATISEINRDLDKVTKLLNTGTVSGFLAFFNSLVIILREGI
ncbi:MAG: hypothetical protein ACE5KE_08540, partial [Methanosarcinales archaeon]